MQKKYRNIEQIPRDNKGGYKVPEGYFDDLNARIMARVDSSIKSLDEEKIAASTKIYRSRPFKRVLATTAVAASVTIAALFISPLIKTSQYDQSDDYDYYMMMSLYNISTQDIIDVNMTEDDDFLSSEMFADAALDFLYYNGYDLVETETSLENQ